MPDGSLSIEPESPAAEFKRRAAAVLGPDFAHRLAIALRSSPGRFRNDTKPQPAVVAIVEILTLIVARGLESKLPGRWTRPAAEPVASFEAVRARWEALLGPNAVNRLAAALDLTARTVSNALVVGKSGRLGVLAEYTAMVELLEIAVATGSVEDLPGRWQRAAAQARSSKVLAPGAEIHTRAVAVLGADATRRIACATGRHETYLKSLFNAPAAAVQPGIVALLEFMELLTAEGVPQSRWPGRWQATDGGA
ncbi:MAG: hypothetical protein CTY28_15970 [Hyphomicrobium sp.]|nr:MAG: hypothetical protein CTY28_15970 [Hyphomicrobium sp.]